MAMAQNAVVAEVLPIEMILIQDSMVGMVMLNLHLMVHRVVGKEIVGE